MEGKENKANGINMVLVVIIVILLGIVGYCAYSLGDTGRSVIDDENLQKGGNTSVTLETEESEEVSKDTNKENTTVPTELDDETQKLVDKVIGYTSENTVVSDGWIFNFVVEFIAQNKIGEINSFSDSRCIGSSFTVSKDYFSKLVKFLSKEKKVQDIVNMQNDSYWNFNRYTIQEEGNNYILFLCGHGLADNHGTLIDKKVLNNQLVLTYDTTCYSPSNSNNHIGETTVILDYIDGSFYYNSSKLQKNGNNIVCEYT